MGQGLKNHEECNYLNNMIVGPKYKICKRLGNGVFEKCQTQKYTLSEARRDSQRGRKRPRMLSDYGKQLIEKQRVRFTYGITERQLTRYVREAMEKKGVDVQDTILQTLEKRLDNIVFRLGLAPTRRAARQMVSHGHITVNNKKASIPSHIVSIEDTIGIRERSEKTLLFNSLKDRLTEYKIPGWLTFNEKKMEGKVKSDPTKDNTEAMFDLTVVMEFYSR